MALTEAQRTTLAAHIRANTDQAVIDALAIRWDAELVRLYNLDSTVVVYLSSASLSQIGMAFDYAEVGNMTSANQERLQTFKDYNEQSVDPSRADIRAFFDDVFSGAGGANTRANLASLWKRFATVAESAFTTGTGTDIDPGALVFEGKITSEDVGRALNENL